MEQLELSNQDRAIARLILREIDERLRFLDNVGVGYLSMERASATLSGGEAQRIRLATQIGSSLVGVLYILDEPSIGLHQRDNERLIATLERLRDLGNTVLVVEHDEGTMRAADYLVDMGPGAGEHGGHVVAEGTAEEVDAGRGVADRASSCRGTRADRGRRRSAASRPATSRSRAPPSTTSRTSTSKVPLGVFMRRHRRVGLGQVHAGQRDPLQGRREQAQPRADAARARTSASRGLEHLDKIISVDQSPIGRTPRSNPATYIGLFDQIRDLYSKTQEARARGYKPGRFSFNVKGGRCEVCRGDGQIKIEMHFLPDIYVPCEQCHGKRYNRETLDIRFKGKTIADVLDMPVEEALEFFAHIPKIKRRLQTLHDVGLDYMRLGQPATTLSGGEAQRIKLAAELAKVATGRTLYILDEPTTGLHFADIQKLLEVLQRLVDAGNSVVVIEHNLDVIKTADRIIDMGPEGGEEGGRLMAAGTPEEVAAVEELLHRRVPARARQGQAGQGRRAAAPAARARARAARSPRRRERGRPPAPRAEPAAPGGAGARGARRRGAAAADPALAVRARDARRARAAGPDRRLVLDHGPRERAPARDRARRRAVHLAAVAGDLRPRGDLGPPAVGRPGRPGPAGGDDRRPRVADLGDRARRQHGRARRRARAAARRVGARGAAAAGAQPRLGVADGRARPETRDRPPRRPGRAAERGRSVRRGRLSRRSGRAAPARSRRTAGCRRTCRASCTEARPW